ncbi:hypothetical protein J4E89_006901 [Alternaria sp. Ai002NY15]|nr:hypothetical protein J4E89_006901 [Alternaria sp. Ai002NY15]
MAVKYVTQPAFSVKLRNAVYNHFIDLDPTVGEATSLARSSQQIRAEFGSLCLASGHVEIPTEHVKSFLHVFFPHHFDSDPRFIPSNIDLSFVWLKSQDWLIGLHRLITIMHQYSLLKISWFRDITRIISTLESMNNRKLAKITSVETELRNTFYHHFIDLSPSTSDAASLACVNQQVHAEFTTLSLSRLYQGTTGVSFEHLPFFLHFFFTQYPNAVPKNVLYKFKVGLGKQGPRSIDCPTAPCWSLDLLKVVSVMRKYPLIKVVWDLSAGMNRYPVLSFDDTDIAYAVTNLRGMSARNFSKLSSIKLTLSESFKYERSFQPLRDQGWLVLNASLSIKSKKGMAGGSFDDFDTKCGGIDVELALKDSGDSEEERSDGEEHVSDDGPDDPESVDRTMPDLGDLTIF